MAFIDYYKKLQVDRSASDKILQAAYRALAKQYHPDTNSSDPTTEEKFKVINNAYETLGDPVKRAEYNKVYDEHYASLGGVNQQQQRYTPPRGANQQQQHYTPPRGANQQQQYYPPPPPNPPVCPHCGRVDHVQQVSSLVASQTWSGSSSSYGFVGDMQANFSSFSQSQSLLSQRLSPPKAPRYQSPWLWMILYLCLGLPFLCIASIVSSSLIMIGIGLTVALAVWCSNEVPRRRAKYYADLPQYNRVMAKWQQLYYCHRDDGVFIPGQGTGFIPTNYMGYFLNEP